MNKRHRKIVSRMRMSFLQRQIVLGGPGYMRRILTPIPLGRHDMNIEYKIWYARVVKRLGSRGLGNWRTKRGIKKRIKWLLINFPVG